MRILLIEKNEFLAEEVAETLQANGAVVDTAVGGEDGAELARSFDFDLVLINLGVTDVPGIDVVRGLRKDGVSVPVLAYQANSKTIVEERVAALKAGADDHLTKPFADEELVARINALVRRNRGFASSDIQLGNLVLNLDTKTVTVAGEKVHLTGKEFQVLQLLAMRRDSAVTKEMMLNHLYGGVDEPEVKIIDVFVCKLRKKINKMRGARIETVWGRGYVFGEVAEAAAPAAERVALVA